MRKALKTQDIALGRWRGSTDLTGRATAPALADQPCSETVDYTSVPIDLVIFALERMNPNSH